MSLENWLFQQKRLAAQEAAKILTKKNLVIFSLASTGKQENSEIIQFTAIDRNGNVLLDQLINPCHPIPYEAQKTHGIQNHDVIDQPTLIEILPKIRKVLHKKIWAGYKLKLDSAILANRLRHYVSTPYIEARISADEKYQLQPELYDIMQIYSQFYGSWSTHQQAFSQQDLNEACKQQGVYIETSTDNTFDNCKRSLSLLNQLANWQKEQKGVVHGKR